MLLICVLLTVVCGMFVADGSAGGQIDPVYPGDGGNRNGVVALVPKTPQSGGNCRNCRHV